MPPLGENVDVDVDVDLNGAKGKSDGSAIAGPSTSDKHKKQYWDDDAEAEASPKLRVQVPERDAPEKADGNQKHDEGTNGDALATAEPTSGCHRDPMGDLLPAPRPIPLGARSSPPPSQPGAYAQGNGQSVRMENVNLRRLFASLFPMYRYSPPAMAPGIQHEDTVTSSTGLVEAHAVADEAHNVQGTAEPVDLNAKAKAGLDRGQRRFWP